MPKKAKRTVNRPSWKKEALKQRQVLGRARRTIEILDEELSREKAKSAELESRVSELENASIKLLSEKATFEARSASLAEQVTNLAEKLVASGNIVVTAEGNVDILQATVAQRDEENFRLEKRVRFLEELLDSVNKILGRKADDIRELRKEVRVRRQISAVLATLHLPGLSIEDAYEQFMGRSRMIGYEPTFQFGRLAGEAYKTASRIVLDHAFSRGVRLSPSQRNNEGGDGMNPIDILNEMLETEIVRSRQEVMDRMRHETSESYKD